MSPGTSGNDTNGKNIHYKGKGPNQNGRPKNIHRPAKNHGNSYYHDNLYEN